jgi:hypothetical protein
VNPGSQSYTPPKAPPPSVPPPATRFHLHGRNTPRASPAVEQIGGDDVRRDHHSVTSVLALSQLTPLAFAGGSVVGLATRPADRGIAVTRSSDLSEPVNSGGRALGEGRG